MHLTRMNRDHGDVDGSERASTLWMRSYTLAIPPFMFCPATLVNYMFIPQKPRPRKSTFASVSGRAFANLRSALIDDYRRRYGPDLTHTYPPMANPIDRRKSNRHISPRFV
ncbi:hypothetical protein MTP99_001042 [Tenebrio molitor]|nr:hypothetical protein MTP99_001042 [Tenebrio molitor]